MIRGIVFLAAAVAALAGSSDAAENAGSPAAGRLPPGEYVNEATWIRTPTVPELKALYPEQMGKTGAKGLAVADCVVSATGALDQCEIDHDSRPGLGFAPAALQALKLFQTSPTAADGRPVAGLHVALLLSWSWPARSTGAGDPEFEALPFPPRPESTAQTSATQSPGPFVIWSPDWVRLPQIDDLTGLYPNAARMNGIRGNATLACRATRQGALGNCVVLREAPTGEGFGEATLKAASYMRLRAALPDGASVEDGIVFFPMKWTF